MQTRDVILVVLAVAVVGLITFIVIQRQKEPIEDRVVRGVAEGVSTGLVGSVQNITGETFGLARDVLNTPGNILEAPFKALGIDANFDLF